MKALPRELAGQWITADCDPTVSFLVEPLKNRHVKKLIAANTDGEDVDGMAASSALARASLKGLKGITEQDDSEFALEYADESFGLTVISCVTEDSYDRLPMKLQGEIEKAAVAACGVGKDGDEDLDFTAASPPSA